VQNPKITSSNTLSDEVKINLNVLGSLMLNWIGCHVDCTDVVAYTSVARLRGVCSSRSSWCSQVASATPLATARYSASALDLETVFWRLEDQETRLSPRNTA
jgi:hypothetical protein